MPADASIYNAFAVKPKSVLEYQQDYAAADDAKLGREINLLKVDSARRGAADEQSLRNYLSGGADLSTAEGQQGLYRAAPTKAGDILKSQAEIAKNRAQTNQATAAAGKSTADTATAQFDLQRKKIDHGVTSLVSAATPDAARQAVQEGLRQGIWDQAEADRHMAAIPNDPAQYQKWRGDTLLAALPAKDQLEQQWKAKDHTLKQETQAEAIRHNRAGEGTAAGQLGVAQGNLGVRRQELERGKVPPGYRLLPDGNMQPIPGGPAENKANKEGNTKTSDAVDVLALLDQAAPLIDKATSSYLGAGIDQTMRVVGASNPGAQAAAQLKALEGSLVSKMPKMSGPQSDKDVLLYKQMAGQIGDPTIPAPQKKAAMATIREINERQAGGKSPAAPAADAMKPFAADKEARYQAWKKANGQ